MNARDILNLRYAEPRLSAQKSSPEDGDTVVESASGQGSACATRLHFIHQH